MKICVYPGSFDPVTNGHLDIIERASKFCDKLIIAVLVNNSKKPAFSLDERVELLKKVIDSKSNIEVESFSGLLVDYMKRKNAGFIIKGLRAVTDFEYELQMAILNKNMDPEIETIFMMSSFNYSFISSSAVRDIAKNNGKIDGLVPDEIKDQIIKKLTGVK